LKGEIASLPALADRYRKPQPRIEAGQGLAPLVSAMMDVSDGLLIDSARLGEASGIGLAIDLASLPISADFLAALGDGRDSRLFAATAGDDYELLFAAPPGAAAAILALAERLGLPISLIGSVEAGAGLRLHETGENVALPVRLGWEHG
jgi:thiamine-monophosphate kinase